MKNGDIDKFEGIKKEVNVKDNFFLLEDSPSIINLKQKKTIKFYVTMATLLSCGLSTN